jgi:hypothetical protein
MKAGEDFLIVAEVDEPFYDTTLPGSEHRYHKVKTVFNDHIHAAVAG